MHHQSNEAAKKTFKTSVFTRINPALWWIEEEFTRSSYAQDVFEAAPGLT